MSRKAAERCALAAVIALAVYGLACFYPTGWSPDSKRVIFPVFRGGKEGEISRLVMTDTQGKVIREVARVENKSDVLSPAAWSPDGKWIAYMKLVRTKVRVGDDKGEFEYRFSLVLQSVETGKEKVIRHATVYEDENDAWMWNFVYGAQWAGDSKSLAAMKMSAEKTGLMAFGLDGKVKAEIPLAGKAAFRTAALSPDAEYVAYFKEGRKKGAAAQYVLCVQSTSDGKIREIAGFPDSVSDKALCRPVWAADSRSFLFAIPEKPEAGEPAGLVKRYAVETARADIVWRGGKNKGVVGISMAQNADTFAVTFMREGKGDDVCGIEVVNVAQEKAIPVHFSETPFWSTSISPDGKWVAFCPMMKVEDEEELVGAIVSSDGRELSFFLPDQKPARYIPELLSTRLLVALHVSGLKEMMKAAGVPEEGKLSPESVAKLAAALDKLAKESNAPLIKEAAAFGKVYVWIKAVADKPPAEREAAAKEARKQLNAFLAAYPKHQVGPVLEKELAEAMKSEPKDKVE